MIVQVKTNNGDSLVVTISNSNDIELLKELLQKLNTKTEQTLDSFNIKMPLIKQMEPSNPNIIQVTCSTI